MAATDEGDDDNTKASGRAHDELEVGHFVTEEQLKAYKAEEIVPDPGTGKPKCYPKGTFIYRLAGRDREKSASYYTPEVADPVPGEVRPQGAAAGQDRRRHPEAEGAASRPWAPPPS